MAKQIGIYFPIRRLADMRELRMLVSEPEEANEEGDHEQKGMQKWEEEQEKPERNKQDAHGRQGAFRRGEDREVLQRRHAAALIAAGQRARPGRRPSCFICPADFYPR